MVSQSPPKKKKFVNSINYFRGLAIVLIVAGHCYGLSRYDVANNFDLFIFALILNSTVYFVFISGFLYYHIFYHKFNYKKFTIKKAQYVLLPYLIASSIPILATVFLLDGGIALPENLVDRPLRAILWYFLTGKVITAYWYIPMAMLLFAISPLVNLIIRSKIVLVSALFLIPISVLIHRPVDNINAFQSLVYFFPVYLLGVWSSINHRQICAYLKDNKKKLILGLIAIALGIIQVWVFKEEGNFHKAFFTVTVPDVNILQKICLCFLFISLLDNYENTNITAINKTAETSFAIYFIHPFLLNALLSIFYKLGIDYDGNFFTLIFTTFAILLGSMAIAYTIKAILKKKSRYLIGW